MSDELRKKANDILHKYFPCTHHAAQMCHCGANLSTATNHIMELIEGRERELKAQWLTEQEDK